MPKVGGKTFPYTPEGKAAAKAASPGKSAAAPGKPAVPGKAFGQGMKGLGRMGKGKK